MQIKPIAYLLIALAFWSQFDYVLLTPAAAAQSVPAPTDDDDDYLLPNLQDQEEQVAPRRQPETVSIRTLPGWRVVGSSPSEWRPTTRFAPSPLCLSMCLQI